MWSISRVAALLFGAGSLLPAVDANNIGTFGNPSVTARPRFRYWLPDSSVSADILKNDIRSAASIGAGGLELLPFFGYGGAMHPEPAGADWAASNFGTQQFNDIFRAALEAHSETGLKMDFAMGPNQGQGVPASTGDDGLQWDLVPFTVPVPNGTFDGTIPGWGVGELVSLVLSEVTAVENKTYSASNGFTTTNGSYIQYTLKNGTLEDYTHTVDIATGNMLLSIESLTNTSSYQLFAFYQKLSLNKNLDITRETTKTIFDNGSYIVDHYSSLGADTVTNFWEDYILSDNVTTLLREVGNYGWEDSVEMHSNISWSRSLPDRFQRLKGYDVRVFLPLLSFAENNVGIQTDAPGSFKCVLDTEDEGQGYHNDFHAVLQDGYREYLQALTNWTHNTLGLEFSAQPSYNLPMDMAATIPDVDAPECESLGFLDNIDLYLKFSGPAQLAGKRVISNELGAVGGKAFQYTIPDLIFEANRGFAGGVNQYVIHGMAYTGTYYNSTWPGYVPWEYIVSETWNEKQPVWSHGMEDAMNYLSRTQQVLQTGVPRIDLAVFWKQSITTLTPGYNLTYLTQEGWTYSYISSENFGLPGAYIENNVLGPDGPAWKALIVYSSQNLTVSALETLSEYADEGLPVVLVDGDPGCYSLKDRSPCENYSSQLVALKDRDTVYSATAEALSSLLKSLGINPRISADQKGSMYTVWRDLAQNATEYAFIFADLVPFSGHITFATTKTPYLLNAWTGEQSPILAYAQNESTITIPIDLKVNQTILLAFSDSLSTEIPTPASHITQTTSQIVGYEFNETTGISYIRVGSSQSTETLSTLTGENFTINSSDVPDAFALSNWTLVAEHWEAPSNLYDVETIAVKRNTTHELNQLQSWLQIPELVNASGIGYYTTTFDWPPLESDNATDLGAYLTTSALLNVVRLQINDHLFTGLDPTNPKIDISHALHRGTNDVLIMAPTVMWNYLKTIFNELRNAGTVPLLVQYTELLGAAPGGIDVGLTGEVLVSPFQTIAIS
ncbi:hypothetical protein PFICI_06577 [Pestalotiopsis fici W106-1]|uniref:Secreted protein n=1 Tax=Pestalotiopsis fici (strain W106-1 / CGMCC3.15140) TaxID=1229662 RepID=W3X6A2_PESFW|nr:uncharacterized protein PFICI_06577 [Pestalotiopsis fici W106-1]ETS81575.1 hypothetical protein PFICI_06577 [Pestalotiopsis fici W106-1]